MSSASELIRELDALIVGAGFGAFDLLHKSAQKLLREGPPVGGVLYWNTYPGARVDADAPIYQLFDKELCEDFTYNEQYPDPRDLKRYFDHVESKWDHVLFGSPTISSSPFPFLPMLWRTLRQVQGSGLEWNECFGAIPADPIYDTEASCDSANAR